MRLNLPEKTASRLKRYIPGNLQPEFSQFIKEPVINKLFGLLGIFFVTILTILTIENYYDKNYTLRYQQTIRNQEQKQKLAFILKEQLMNIQLDFRYYQTANTQRQLSALHEQIRNRIEESFYILKIIDEGGTFTYRNTVNLPMNDEITEIISYTNDYYTGSISEVRDLFPPISDLQSLSTRIATTIRKWIESEDFSKEEMGAAIAFYLKQADSIFERIYETERKIAYDIQKNVVAVNNTSVNVLGRYNRLKYISLIVFCLFAGLITYILIIQISRIILFRKRAEQESNKLLMAVEQSPVAIMITNTRGITEYVNESFVKKTGYNKQEAIGRKPYFFSNHGIYDFSQVMMTTIQAGNVWSGDVETRNKNGRLYWERIQISPVFNEFNTISNFIIIREDITEKKQLTQSLNESLNNLQTITENLPVGILISDDNQEIIQINQTAAEIMGFPNPEKALEYIKQKGYSQLFDKTNHKIETKTIGDIEVVSQEERLSIAQNNVSRTILKNIIPISLNNRSVKLEAFMDITAQKEMQRKETEANKAKSDFLANMSHEIRTPMNGIVGATELLSQSRLSNEQRNTLEVISKSCDNLLNIINDILDFSKIEAGKMNLENYPFNLKSTVEYLTDQISFKANKKQLEVVVSIDDKIPSVLIGDEGRLIQILINLLGNAVKFTNQGEIILRIDYENTGNDTWWLHFRIEDSGIGIPPEKIEKIFESFTQADGSTTRRYGGTGLGTSIAKMLTELMGGRIWVESPNPKIDTPSDQPGTIFHVVLPFKCDIQNGDIEKFPEKFNTLKILLLENHHTNILLMNKTLRNWGLKPRISVHRDETLDILRSEQDFDLIIADCSLLQGFEKAFHDELIQVSARTKQILLVTEFKHVFKCYDKTILKPIKQSALRTAIFELFYPQWGNNTKENYQNNAPVEYQNGHRTILLVEDNPINQKIAEKMLTRLHYEVIIAHNGQDAVDYIANDKKHIDLILMDIQMPMLNGLDATRILRNRGVYIPIIAMTANALKGDREACIDAGMNDYLGKPVKMEMLETTLTRWLGTQNGSIKKKLPDNS